MYSSPRFLTSENPQFLIVKTSSLGDIIQAFSALNDLQRRFPTGFIDWVVEERFAPIVRAHPLVRRTISFNLKKRNWKDLLVSLQQLRSIRYDAVFDLQGNCKSGVLTAFTRSPNKVGFGRKSVREWPNLLATHLRFEVPRSLNIRLQHIRLIEQFFKQTQPAAIDGVRFKIADEERAKVEAILAYPALQHPIRIMVCPGSKWINKQLSLETLIAFLRKIEQALDVSYLWIWGAQEEKEICKSLEREFHAKSAAIDRLALPTWQNLMVEMQLVIAVDSSALHLCGTTSTPSFSIFGPTSPEIFKPIGPQHRAYQGSCPYQRTFEKQCPVLRTCPTGACIRQIAPDALFHDFWTWWNSR